VGGLGSSSAAVLAQLTAGDACWRSGPWLAGEVGPGGLIISSWSAAVLLFV
jgi:hypothetical protein